MKIGHSFAEGLDCKGRGVRQFNITRLSLLVKDGHTLKGRIPGGESPARYPQTRHFWVPPIQREEINP